MRSYRGPIPPPIEGPGCWGRQGHTARLLQGSWVPRFRVHGGHDDDIFIMALSVRRDVMTRGRTSYSSDVVIFIWLDSPSHAGSLLCSRHQGEEIP